MMMDRLVESTSIIRHNGIGHHPRGAGSYYFRDDIINWRCGQTPLPKVNIFIGAQPNSSPHMGNLTNIAVAFAVAQRLREKEKSVTVYFDAVDTAPTPGCEVEQNNITYQKSLRSTGHDNRYLKQFDEILDGLSRLSGVQVKERTQEEILRGPGASECLRELILHREQLGRLSSPRTEIPCLYRLAVIEISLMCKHYFQDFCSVSSFLSLRTQIW
jgi:hypothetical protein